MGLSFRDLAIKLKGKLVKIGTCKDTFVGVIVAVGSDFLVLVSFKHGHKIRRIIRLKEIVFLIKIHDFKHP